VLFLCLNGMRFLRFKERNIMMNIPGNDVLRTKKTSAKDAEVF